MKRAVLIIATVFAAMTAHADCDPEGLDSLNGGSDRTVIVQSSAHSPVLEKAVHLVYEIQGDQVVGWGVHNQYGDECAEYRTDYWQMNEQGASGSFLGAVNEFTN